MSREIRSNYFVLFIVMVFMFILSPLINVNAAETSTEGINIPKAPTNNIYVQDYAKVLTQDTTDYIMKYSTELNHLTGAQICVVTIDSLQGKDIKNYANELFRSWGIGDKDKNNGVLILLAVNDHKARIEVGRGIEGDLTDIESGRVLDNVSQKYFKVAKYDEGIKEAYNQIFTIIGNSQTSRNDESTKMNNSPSPLVFFIIFAVIVSVVIVVILIYLKLTEGEIDTDKNSNSSGTFSSINNVIITQNTYTLDEKREQAEERSKRQRRQEEQDKREQEETTRSSSNYNSYNYYSDNTPTSYGDSSYSSSDSFGGGDSGGGGSDSSW
jgi:uncharacterized protein